MRRLGSTSIAADHVYMRWQLELRIARDGAQAGAHLLDMIEDRVRALDQEHAAGQAGVARNGALAAEHDAGVPVPAGVPWNRAQHAEAHSALDDNRAERDELAEILAITEHQLHILHGERDALIADMNNQGRSLAAEILATSEERVRGEIARYGIELAPLWANADHARYETAGQPRYQGNAASTAERQALAQAAGEIAASERALIELRRRNAGLDQAADPGSVSDAGASSSDEFPAQCVAGVPMLAEQHGDLLAALARATERAEREHVELCLTREAEFPILATFLAGAAGHSTGEDAGEDAEHGAVDLDGLDRLAAGQGTDALGAELFGVLGNIGQVRRAMDSGDLSIWQLPPIVALAAQRMAVAPGSARDRFVQEAAADHGRDSLYRSLGLWAVAIGLALITAVPTGGSASVAIVAGAQIAGLALDAYLLLDSLEQYSLQRAAGHTDMDRARAMAREEPSLLWLAVDLLGAGLGVAAAARAFSELAAVRRAVVTGAGHGPGAAPSLAMLERVAAAHGIEARTVARLRRELVALGGNSGPGRGAADLAGDSADLGRLVSPADAERLGRELGLPLELETGPVVAGAVRVTWELGPRGRVRAGVVRVGRLASVADVLAHREVARLLRRYDGLTGRWLELWDRLVLRMLGRGGAAANPFPPASEAWHSWYELRKLPQLVELRLGAMSRGFGHGGELDAGAEAVLRHEIATLTREYEHHRRVVERVALEPGRGYIASPDLGALGALHRAAEPVLARDDLPAALRERIAGLLAETATDPAIASSTIRSIIAQMARASGEGSVREALAELEHLRHTAAHADLAPSTQVHGAVRAIERQGVERPFTLGDGTAVTLAPLTEVDAIYKVGDVVHIDEVKHTAAALRNKIRESDQLDRLIEWRGRDEARRQIAIVVATEQRWTELLRPVRGRLDTLQVLADEGVPLLISGRRLSVEELASFRQKLEDTMLEMIAEGRIDEPGFFQLPEMKTIAGALELVERAL